MISGIVVGAVLAIFGRQIQTEFQDWTPRSTSKMLERAVKKLPPDKQERYHEEWRSYLDDVPGQVGKWWVAFGFQRAARKMNVAAEGHPWHIIVSGRTAAIIHVLKGRYNLGPRSLRLINGIQQKVLVWGMMMEVRRLIKKGEFDR